LPGPIYSLLGTVRRQVEFRAVIKRSGEWWIGWLVDLSGVNAQERTRDELLESLKIGAEDMIKTPYQPKNGEELVHINV
jgi:predicted RNase H-like HicB family nuclease